MNNKQIKYVTECDMTVIQCAIMKSWDFVQ